MADTGSRKKERTYVSWRGELNHRLAALMATDYDQYLSPPPGQSKKSVSIAWSKSLGIHDRDPKGARVKQHVDKLVSDWTKANDKRNAAGFGDRIDDDGNTFTQRDQLTQECEVFFELEPVLSRHNVVGPSNGRRLLEVDIKEESGAGGAPKSPNNRISGYGADHYVNLLESSPRSSDTRSDFGSPLIQPQASPTGNIKGKAKAQTYAFIGSTPPGAEPDNLVTPGTQSVDLSTVGAGCDGPGNRRDSIPVIRISSDSLEGEPHQATGRQANRGVDVRARYSTTHHTSESGSDDDTEIYSIGHPPKRAKVSARTTPDNRAGIATASDLSVTDSGGPGGGSGRSRLWAAKSLPMRKVSNQSKALASLLSDASEAQKRNLEVAKLQAQAGLLQAGGFTKEIRAERERDLSEREKDRELERLRLSIQADELKFKRENHAEELTLRREELAIRRLEVELKLQGLKRDTGEPEHADDFEV